MKRKEYKHEYDVFETPKDLWSNIESKLDAPAKKRRIGLWSTIGGAAAVLLVTLLVTNQQESNPESKTAQKNFMADSRDLKTTMPDREDAKNKKVQANTSSSEQDTGVGNAVTPNADGTATMDMALRDVGSANSNGNNIGWSGTANGTVHSNFTRGRNNGGVASNIPNPYAGEYVGKVANQNQQSLLQKSMEMWDMDVEPTHGSTYDAIQENNFISTAEESQSTFSIDVDGASYSDVRGMIQRGVLPNANAVRMEELINYFPYNYDEPTGEHPFAFHSEVIDCPWNSKHQLMKIGIKGESIQKEALPPNNLVFLLDVSGSMTSADKLGLIKKGFNLLVQEMREEDRIAICVYAGAAGVVLEPTSGANKDKIMDAINRLEAGGSTAGGQGIELAYATAQKYFNPKGNNRVILATDGDFNVGMSNDDALVKLIERKRETGVALTILGVGHDNFQSSKMEKLANNGNGNFSYIDNILEAKKVLVTEMGATLKTIAKDVKIQLDFNPDQVASYRLIGYENRLLANEDFDNDAVDAGELGAGHTVTAIYEIIPGKSEGNTNGSAVENLINIFTGNTFEQEDLAVLKFRYKQPLGSESQLIRTNISNQTSATSTDMYFITAVIEYGLLLRDSEYKGTANFDRILQNARMGLGRDPYGYRSEFIQLVQKTKRLKQAD
ncbi:MAG: hypothetical protein Crog4KO_30490 [Crocinitomicaceae bacterium]